MIEALLDTHALLWILAGDSRVPRSLVNRINSSPSDFGVSDATIWEIAIKRSTGKLTAPDDLPETISEFGFTHIPITRRQAWTVRNLPLLHRDPFDRLLISQALDLHVPLASEDEKLNDYAVEVLWS